MDASALLLATGIFLSTALAFFVCIAGYLSPTLVAAARNHQDYWRIFVVNLFLGWTVVGWMIALIWSAGSEAPIRFLRPLPTDSEGWSNDRASNTKDL